MLPTEFGNFRIRAYADDSTLKEHAALYTGNLEQAPLVRIHSECLTGDAFGSLKCDCGPQLHRAMRRAQEEGAGVILYLRQEGRDIGLYAKMQAYNLQDQGLDTMDANLALGLPCRCTNLRDGGRDAPDLGVSRIRLMTNNPLKRQAMIDAGIDVVERVQHIAGTCEHNRDYLATKARRMGHMLDIEAV